MGQDRSLPGLRPARDEDLAMANSASVDKAHQVLRQAYLDDVRGLAEDVCQWWDQNGDATRDDLIEYLDESVDGHGRVIYTGQAIETLRYSEHDDAFLDEMGEWPSTKDGTPWSQLAYAAFRRDVVEHLESAGVGLNDQKRVCPTCGERSVDDSGDCETVACAGRDILAAAE